MPNFDGEKIFYNDDELLKLLPPATAVVAVKAEGGWFLHSIRLFNPKFFMHRNELACNAAGAKSIYPKFEVKIIQAA